MELPDRLKALYRHWPLHTTSGNLPLPSGLDKEVLGQVIWFVSERLAMWERKAANQTPPYTDDPVLTRFRFCNIFREFDRQTIEFHEMLNPLRDDFPLWLLNMFYCRMVARPETIRNTGLVSFEDRKNQGVYAKLMALPRPRFGNAYVFPVSVIQRSETPTRELFITQYLPTAIPAAAREIQVWQKESFYDGLKKVLPIFGYNLSFLWTEVLIDVAYQFPELLDPFKRFPIGPGAGPTLKKLDPKKDPSVLVQELCPVKVDIGITFDGKPLVLSAENWEGIACEFRKYTNLCAGRGRHRIYRPVSD